MKTAKIEVGHVFGTKSTNYAEVCYRGKHLFFRMGNESRQMLCDKAVEWAKANSFTHVKVNQFS